MDGWHGIVVRIASRQHGLVTRAQLREAGIGRGAIQRQIELGRLIAVHRGVYAVGHPALPQRANEMAAVLACGLETGVVSHLSATFMWGLLPYPTASGANPPIDVSVTRGRPNHEGIKVHVVKPIYPRDRKVIDGVPVTGVARTLLDVAALGDEYRLGKAVNEAKIRGLLRNDPLDAVLKRYPRRAGTGLLLEQLADSSYSRSVAEDRLAALIAAHKFPPPSRNVKVDDLEVDFVWPEQKVVVEFDGFIYHSSRLKFDGDHGRVAKLRLAGYDVIRVTWRQITRDPKTVAKLIRQALLGGLNTA